MIILPLLLAVSLVTTPTLTAGVPTEAVPTSTNEIQKFREIIQEKVKAKLQEINQTTTTDPKRGFIGTITKVDSNSLNLDTKNKNISLVLNSDTVILNSKSTKIKLTDLKVGQEILVIGLIDDQNVVTAKRIIVTTLKLVQNPKTVIFGQIVDKSDMYSLLALIPNSNKNIQYQINTNSKGLQIVSPTGDKMTLKDVIKGKKIIIITTSPPSPSQTLTVEKIIVL